MAFAILKRTPDFEPSSIKIVPRFLKLVTVPCFCPLILISCLMPSALFVISLVVSALISIIPCAGFVETSARDSSFSSSSARVSMSSANYRLVLVLPPMLTVP